jgi:DNA-binding GntR family transcriptional regulator
VRVTLEPVQTREYSPIREEVFTMLRQAILTGKLQPGDRLVERELAEQLGVSRTPVREALRKLELENLVTHIPRKGVVVSEISKRDVIEIFDIRASLEGLASNLAAQKATSEEIKKLNEMVQAMETAANNKDVDSLNEIHDQFHKQLIIIADSPRLKQMINSLSDYINRFTKAGYAIPGRSSAAMQEHRELMESIEARDSLRAQSIAASHIMNSKAVVLKQYEEYNGSKLREAKNG